jgi:HTH-type transcriptional regulator, competence development regulator
MSNKSLGELLREQREQKGLLLREVAAAFEMDTAILSKIERDERKANKDQVIAFAKYYKVNVDDLLVAWLSDKLVFELQYEELALKAMQVAEEKIKYQNRKK